MYVGEPINAIRIFNEKEIDELMVQDIIAWIKKREPVTILLKCLQANILSRCIIATLFEIQIRLAYFFCLGVKKLAIQTNALNDFDLVKSIAYRYGNQSVFDSVEVKKSFLALSVVFSSKVKSKK
jgi:cyclase